MKNFFSNAMAVISVVGSIGLIVLIASRWPPPMPEQHGPPAPQVLTEKERCIESMRRLHGVAMVAAGRATAESLSSVWGTDPEARKAYQNLCVAQCESAIHDLPSNVRIGNSNCRERFGS